MKLKTARPVARLRQGRTDWYRIKAQAGTAEIAIYDEIGYFGVTARDFLDELKALDVKQIDVRINSPGGDVWDGLAIYNSLRDHPATVTTYVDGLAASAASIIVQAGNRRVAAKASELMIHEAWGLVVGNATDMRDAADRLDQASGMIAGVYADRAGGTVDGWREAMRAESWYTGAEAADAGLVDEVAGGGGQAAQDSWDLSIYAHAGRAQAPAPTIQPADDEFDVASIAEALQGAFACQPQ
jgi:ATP-dependent Clp endopeptidase proteolytic subunit ClpP